MSLQHTIPSLLSLAFPTDQINSGPTVCVPLNNYFAHACAARNLNARRRSQTPLQICSLVRQCVVTIAVGLLLNPEGRSDRSEESIGEQMFSLATLLTTLAAFCCCLTVRSCVSRSLSVAIPLYWSFVGTSFDPLVQH